MSSIRNIAAENHIRAVLISHGCTPLDVRQQSDYYLVSFHQLGENRSLTASSAAELREILEKESLS